MGNDTKWWQKQRTYGWFNSIRHIFIRQVLFPDDTTRFEETGKFGNAYRLGLKVGLYEDYLGYRCNGNNIKEAQKEMLKQALYESSPFFPNKDARLAIELAKTNTDELKKAPGFSFTTAMASLRRLFNIPFDIVQYWTGKKCIAPLFDWLHKQPDLVGFTAMFPCLIIAAVPAALFAVAAIFKLGIALVLGTLELISNAIGNMGSGIKSLFSPNSENGRSCNEHSNTNSINKEINLELENISKPSKTSAKKMNGNSNSTLSKEHSNILHIKDNNNSLAETTDPDVIDEFSVNPTNKPWKN